LIVILLIGGGALLVRNRTTPAIDPLSGIWTGDWGPTPSHRNSVTVNLKWDGATLTGVVNPGPHAVQLTIASFDARESAVHFELKVPSGERELHYVIDGTVEGATLVGTWRNDVGKGSLRLIRK